MWQAPSPTSPTSPTGTTGFAPLPSPSTSAPTYRLRNQGKRIAQIIKLKPEFLGKYKEIHARVWPEVLKQIKDCAIEDYSIFYDADSGILFASFKYVGYNYAGDMEKMRENPKVQEWWKMTDGMQTSLVEGATHSANEEIGWWKPLEEVFYVS